MDTELARRIQRQMNSEGFHAAAEDFMSRTRLYSERELNRIARFWLS